jgi:hypothetical protein
MSSPRNSPVKSYTYIFDITYKLNGPILQIEVSLERSESTGEVGGSSLILIYFCVPFLTQLLHCIESALQFSEHIALSAVCCLNTHVIREKC